MHDHGILPRRPHDQPDETFRDDVDDDDAGDEEAPATVESPPPATVPETPAAREARERAIWELAFANTEVG